MRKNKDYEFRYWPYLGCFIFHWALFILSWAAIILVHDTTDDITHMINVYFSIITPIVLIVSLILSIFGWNATIYFDKEKIYQKRYGKLIEIYWKDIVKVKCKTHRCILFRWPPYAPRVRIYSSKHNKSITFSLEKYVRDRFLNVCTNEDVKKRYSEILDECDFPFF